MTSTSMIERELRSAVEGEVRFDQGSRTIYATDASNYRQVPVGVVIPRDANDVVAAVAIAREHRVPILPRGGGTSLGGQGCNAALVIDFSKYVNAIRSIDIERRLAVVEPGVVPTRLNAELAPHGLFFAPDPTTKDRCNIGGMIGNNSCGAHSVAYGKTADNLHALDVLLYDGTRMRLGGNGDITASGARATQLIAELRVLGDRFGDLVRARYPRIPRRVSGYNLDQLLPENGFNVARAMVGSEGTLAVTLEATLQLVPLPRRRALVVAGFDDVFVAADHAPSILDYQPHAVEGFDGRLVEFVKLTGMHLEQLRLLPPGGGFLLVEFGGDRDDEVRGRAESVRERLTRSAGCTGAVAYFDEREQRAVWTLRESGLGSSAFIPGFPRTYPGAEDVAVAPERLGAFLRRFAALLNRRGLEVASYYGHFGDGCVHTRINFDFESRAGVVNFRSTMEELADLVVEFGGSLSGEHGDGLARSELLPKMFGPELIGAFREFKRIFDPDGMMNPGVIVNPHPLDSHLRIEAERPPPALDTHFDFTPDGGFAGAASRCVGIGKCRKLDAGTMCPSYMATMEEAHSTRGRARLLQEALSGSSFAVGANAEEVREALELCLSCKGCKRECPAGVDMATYKAEFLAHYHEAHRRSPGEWLFGRIADFARLGAMWPRAANGLAQSGAGAAMMRALFGIHRERALPRLAPQTFRAWFDGNRIQPTSGAREVVLFPDTFNNFFEPEVAIAATHVLDRAGFRVTIPPTDLCCGRPLYDQGMLDVARRRLQRVLDVLTPYVQRGVTIVGLEPSCILTFRDELLRLFPDDSRARALSQSALLFDEFLARDAPNFAPATIGRPALIHGHCHQKAVAGIASEVTMVKECSSAQVTELDAGCCGMAGGFGYARDHFEISHAIGERVLLPAVRGSAPDTLIVADGFSCRAQIAQFCPGRRAMHLAQLLDLATTPA